MKKMLTILCAMASMTPHASAVSYNYDLQRGSLGFCWQYDDMCGILTEKNTEIIHWVVTSDNASCTLSSYGWALAPDEKYYAYYPYSKSYYKTPMTALPISYAGQQQKGNDCTEHLAACDFMAAQTMSADDACHFDFLHLGSVMRVECKLSADCTLTALTLKAEKNDFINTATMDVISGTVTPLTCDCAVTLKLNSVYIKKGETLIAYMMLPPADLSGQTLALTLSSSYGDIYTAEVKGTEITPGHLYPLTVEMPPFWNDEGNDDSPAEGYPLQYSQPMSVAASEVTIKAPTASAPVFVTDSSHRFEQIVKKEEASCITGNKVASHQRKVVYDLNGMRTVSTAQRGLVISNGRKYINERR